MLKICQKLYIVHSCNEDKDILDKGSFINHVNQYGWSGEVQKLVHVMNIIFIGAKLGGSGGSDAPAVFLVS